MQHHARDGSDIDMSNRVASVTLESDSLSEAPTFRNKRRKRLPRREKFMRIDTKKDRKELSSTTSISTSDRDELPGFFFLLVNFSIRLNSNSTFIPYHLYYQCRFTWPIYVLSSLIQSIGPIFQSRFLGPIKSL